MSTEQNMSSVPGIPGLPVFRHELAAVRDHWWWFLLMGILLVVMGTFAVGAATIVTLVSVMFFGFLLLAAGVIQIVSSFWSGRWSGTLLHVLIGILYLITGLIIVDRPLESEFSLTLVIAFFLLAAGIFRIVAALMERFHDWGWVLLNGIVTLMLGLLILKQWPSSALWVIGLFVGIDMIFNGWAWIMLSIGLRTLKDRSARPPAEPPARSLGRACLADLGRREGKDPCSKGSWGPFQPASSGRWQSYVRQGALDVRQLLRQDVGSALAPSKSRGFLLQA